MNCKKQKTGLCYLVMERFLLDDWMKNMNRSHLIMFFLIRLLLWTASMVSPDPNFPLVSLWGWYLYFRDVHPPITHNLVCLVFCLWLHQQVRVSTYLQHLRQKREKMGSHANLITLLRVHLRQIMFSYHVSTKKRKTSGSNGSSIISNP